MSIGVSNIVFNICMPLHLRRHLMNILHNISQLIFVTSWSYVFGKICTEEASIHYLEQCRFISLISNSLFHRMLIWMSNSAIWTPVSLKISDNWLQPLQLYKAVTILGRFVLTSINPLGIFIQLQQLTRQICFCHPTDDDNVWSLLVLLHCKQYWKDIFICMITRVTWNLLCS